jgi:signal transduction histidine kinase
VATIVFILLLALLFAVYKYYLDRQLRQKEEALDAKRAFVRFISHEIRTPLNTVCLGLKLLQDESDPSSLTKFLNNENLYTLHEEKDDEEESFVDIEIGSQSSHHTTKTTSGNTKHGRRDSLRSEFDKKISHWKDLLKDVEESSNNAVDVLNELMCYDKIEMKTMKIEKEVLPIWTVLNNAVRPFYIQAREKDITMEFLLDSTDAARPVEMVKKNMIVIGDGIRLTQVFRNVISNALKFSPVSSVVEVSVVWNPNKLRSIGDSIAADCYENDLTLLLLLLLLLQVMPCSKILQSVSSLKASEKSDN